MRTPGDVTGGVRGLRSKHPSTLLAAAAAGLVLVPLGYTVGGCLLDALAPANEGAFEGGATGTDADAGVNNVRQPGDLLPEPLVGPNLPTDAPPSPLFGAQPFEQKMLRFEEFGPRRIVTHLSPGDPFPPPKDAQSGPDAADLENFLRQDLWPRPKRVSNVTDENPWKADIEAFIGRPLDTPPCEGRPPGEGWAHQRWSEFPPTVYFTTAMAGARPNGGLRDRWQRHNYSMGEFGPDGLYHAWADGGDGGSCRGIHVKFHPNMPEQDPESLWCFDGTLPPKLLMARYGEGMLMRLYNGLPIDPSANAGFGVHTISVHEHNGHNPAESDGYTNAFFFPGQYYDYHWPMIIAGRDTVNTDATDPRAGMPDGHGGIINVPGDYRETMSTHWFHDHMLDFTAQNVYKGNAAMMNYYSSIDRGNEALNDGVNLRLPSGSALDWGNRDYDVNLVVADKAWDEQGQLWFNIFNTDGFMGDQLLTNWLWKPFFDVRARRYRFRLLNGSVSRYLKIALVVEVPEGVGEFPGPVGSGVSYTRIPFHMVANDGNIMEHAVAFDGTLGTDRAILPTQGIAERYDIVVDFARFQPGTKLYFVNVLEHFDGKNPERAVPLADILSGAYSPAVVGGRWDADPCVGKFMELRVHEYAGEDLSMNPRDYVAGGLQMIPLPRPSAAELAAATHRTFEFGRGGNNATDDAPWVITTDQSGNGFNMDPRRLSAAPNKGALTAEGLGHLEIWNIVNDGGGWSHPVHVHFEEGIILERDGLPPPEWERWARKDVYRIGVMPDSGRNVEMAIRFREFAGTYMEHCHNTQHEDHAMLLRWDIENPGQVTFLPAPIPTWDGVEYVESCALPTARFGDGVGPGN